MERKNNSYGTNDNNTLSASSTTTNTDTLNTDEDSILDTPLRPDLESGTSADVSAGVTAGPDFLGNSDADTDSGLPFATTGVTDTYSIPATITEPTSTVDAPDAIDTAKEKIGDAKSALSSAAESAKSQVGHLAEQAKTQVSELTAQATDKVKEQLGGHKDKAAEGLTSITDAIRQSASTLEEKGQAPIAGAVTGLASQVEQFADYLHNKSVDELAADVTAYAKKNPQVFIGGAFLLGIALARFLKSSGQTTSGSYNTATVTSGSNSFNSTPVIPSYTGTTDYQADTSYDSGSTLGSGSNFGTGSTDYSTVNRAYTSMDATAI